MDAFTPAQTTELISRIGAKKAKMRLDKLFFNSCLGGALLGFGSALALSTETAPWFAENAPGLIRTIGAATFPVGLVMIVLTGADLATSNFMYMPVALVDRRCSMLDLLINWTVSFFGNLAGILFFTIIICGYGGVFSSSVYRPVALSFATGKCVTPAWHQIFLRAIGCNWAVCIAVFHGISAREIVSKIVGIWLPILTFVALGFDHVIANMFFMPLAIFLGHPDITVGFYIWKSMIPALLGNIVGAVVFVSLPYWYFYLNSADGVQIHFDIGGARAAIHENAGPMDLTRQMTAGSYDFAATGHGHRNMMPDSHGHVRSGLAAELNKEKYGKGERSSSTSPTP